MTSDNMKIVRHQTASKNSPSRIIKCAGCGVVFKFISSSLAHVNRRKYCQKSCRHKGHSQEMTGATNSHWKRGWFVRGGYLFVYLPQHPFANSLGYLRYHRLVVERYLGRYLKKQEVVHHKNENRLDNRIENLEVTNSSDHMKHHARIMWAPGGLLYDRRVNL